MSKGRSRITPYIPHALRQQLRQHCASVRTTERAVIELALRKHLEGTSDKTVLLRQLDRVGRTIAIALAPVEAAFAPTAIEPDCVACELRPSAIAFSPELCAFEPMAKAFVPVADAAVPVLLALK